MTKCDLCDKTADVGIDVILTDEVEEYKVCDNCLADKFDINDIVEIYELN